MRLVFLTRSWLPYSHFKRYTNKCTFICSVLLKSGKCAYIILYDPYYSYQLLPGEIGLQNNSGDGRKEGKAGENRIVGRGEAKKGEWHVPCATVSVLCKLPLTLEPKGEAPEAVGACNCGRKAYKGLVESLWPTCRQDNRVPGTPGMLSSELPLRILLSLTQLIFYKAGEKKSMPDRSTEGVWQSYHPHLLQNVAKHGTPHQAAQLCGPVCHTCQGLWDVHKQSQG